MPVWFGIALLGLQASAPQVAAPPPSPWTPVQLLVGEWEGESEGEPGKGQVRRTYRFVLKDRFLYEQNVSTYPPQPKNEKGEVHEHWSLFSHDRGRGVLVLRQFHQEGFVNQYAMQPKEGDTAVPLGALGSKVVFESEALENVPSGWKARETYEFPSADVFSETFELAQGGGAWAVYSRARFKRKR